MGSIKSYNFAFGGGSKSVSIMGVTEKDGTEINRELVPYGRLQIKNYDSDWVHLSDTNPIEISVDANDAADAAPRSTIIYVKWLDGTVNYDQLTITQESEPLSFLKEISLENVVWNPYENISCDGGVADIHNILSYTVVAKNNNGYMEDITKSSIITGSKEIIRSGESTDHIAGQLKLDATYICPTYGTFTASSYVDIWQDEYISEPRRPLHFTAYESIKISLLSSGGNNVDVEYSFNNSYWYDWDFSASSYVEIGNSINGQHLYVRGINIEGFSQSPSEYTKFVIDNYDDQPGAGSVCYVDGSVMSLIDYRSEIDTIPSEFCFYRLFSNTSIVSAPELPAANISDGCYERMFENCAYLKKSPELSVTNLSPRCYRQMFEGCSSLEEITIDATNTVADECTYNWVKDVTTTSGVFNQDPSMNWNYGNDGVPVGWTKSNIDLPTEIKFTSQPKWTYDVPAAGGVANINNLTDYEVVAVYASGNVDITDDVTFYNDYTVMEAVVSDRHIVAKFNVEAKYLIHGILFTVKSDDLDIYQEGLAGDKSRIEWDVTPIWDTDKDLSANGGVADISYYMTSGHGAYKINYVDNDGVATEITSSCNKYGKRAIGSNGCPDTTKKRQLVSTADFTAVYNYGGKTHIATCSGDVWQKTTASSSLDYIYFKKEPVWNNIKDIPEDGTGKIDYTSVKDYQVIARYTSGVERNVTGECDYSKLSYTGFPVSDVPERRLLGSSYQIYAEFTDEDGIMRSAYSAYFDAYQSPMVQLNGIMWSINPFWNANKDIDAHGGIADKSYIYDHQILAYYSDNSYIDITNNASLVITGSYICPANNSDSRLKRPDALELEASYMGETAPTTCDVWQKGKVILVSIEYGRDLSWDVTKDIPGEGGTADWNNLKGYRVFANYSDGRRINISKYSGLTYSSNTVTAAKSTSTYRHKTGQTITVEASYTEDGITCTATSNAVEAYQKGITIYITDIDWAKKPAWDMSKDIPAIGGTASILNTKDYQVIAIYSNGEVKDITSVAIYKGTLPVAASSDKNRHKVEDPLTVTVEYGLYSYLASKSCDVTVWQASAIEGNLANIVWSNQPEPNANKDVPAQGGYVTIANYKNYSVKAEFDTGEQIDITDSCEITITSPTDPIPESSETTRHIVSDVYAYFKATFIHNGVTKTATTGQCQIWQAAKSTNPLKRIFFYKGDSFTEAQPTWNSNKNVPAKGGYATKDNLDFKVGAEYNDGTKVDITNRGAIEGHTEGIFYDCMSEYIEPTYDTRGVVDTGKDYTITATYAEDGVECTITSDKIRIYQDPWVASGILTGLYFKVQPVWDETKDIISDGGTATIDNLKDYELTAIYNDGGAERPVTLYADDYIGSVTIPAAEEHMTTRHSAGSIVITARYSDGGITKTCTADAVTIWQSAYRKPTSLIFSAIPQWNMSSLVPWTGGDASYKNFDYELSVLYSDNSSEVVTSKCSMTGTTSGITQNTTSSMVSKVYPINVYAEYRENNIVVNTSYETTYVYQMGLKTLESLMWNKQPKWDKTKDISYTGGVASINNLTDYELSAKYTDGTINVIKSSYIEYTGSMQVPANETHYRKKYVSSYTPFAITAKYNENGAEVSYMSNNVSVFQEACPLNSYIANIFFAYEPTWINDVPWAAYQTASFENNFDDDFVVCANYFDGRVEEIPHSQITKGGDVITFESQSPSTARYATGRHINVAAIYNANGAQYVVYAKPTLIYRAAKPSV